MYTLLLKTMTKSQTSSKTQSAKQIVRQLSGIASKRSVTSLTRDRYVATEEYDPTKEHDEMLIRLSEIKALRDELDFEEKTIKSKIRKDLLAYEEDGDVPEIHYSLDEKLYAGFRRVDTYQYSPKLETRIEEHAKETKLIKNKKDAEKLNDVAKLIKTTKSVVLYRPQSFQEVWRFFKPLSIIHFTFTITMTTVIFEYNGKSKEIPINEIKSVNDVAEAYEKLGLISKIPVKRRLYYFIPNGKYHSFLSNKNHKYAVCCTEKDTKVGGHYTDDYARAKDIAENLNRKMNNPEYGYRKWVVVDIKGGRVNG